MAEDAADLCLDRRGTAARGPLRTDPVGDRVDRLGELGAGLLDLLLDRVRTTRLRHVISLVGPAGDPLTVHHGPLPRLAGGHPVSVRACDCLPATPLPTSRCSTPTSSR